MERDIATRSESDEAGTRFDPDPNRVTELILLGLSPMQAIDYIKVVEDGMTATAWAQTEDRGKVTPQSVAANVRKAKRRIVETDD